MIIFISMALVYRHIRKDTDEVFYIGIASRKDRPYSKSSRNPHWHNIVNKAGYRVEIIKDGINLELAKELEIKLIEEYGDKLCNMTKGGDGQFGLSTPKSQETKNKISESIKEWHKNNSHSIESRKKMSDAAKKQRSTGEPTHTSPHSQESKQRMAEARREWWRKKKAGLL